MDILKNPEELKIGFKKWIYYKQNVMKFAKLEEVVENPCFLSLAKNEKNAENEKDIEALPDIARKVHRLIEKFIEQTLKEVPRGRSVKKYIENFERYKKQKEKFIAENCGDRPVQFDIAWNYVIQNCSEEFQNKLIAFYVNNFGLDDKNIDNAPLVIDKNKIEKSMLKERVVIQISEDKLLLLPKKARIKVFCRHGRSVHDSSKKKVGRLCTKGQVLSGKGEKVARDLSIKMAGALDLVLKTAEEHGIMLKIRNSEITVSTSPNTGQFSSIFLDELSKKIKLDESKLNNPVIDPANNSQNFGLETNLNKEQEKSEIQKATGFDEDQVNKFISNPLRIFLGSNEHKIDYFLQDILAFRKIMEKEKDEISMDFAFTHSSRLNNILVFLSPIKFHEAYQHLNKSREGTDVSIMVAYNPLTKTYSKYDSWVGETTSKEKVVYTIKVIREEINNIGVLAGGGTAPSMNNVLRTVANTIFRHSKKLTCFRGGFKGLVNNQIFPNDRLLQLLGDPGMRIGAGRFEEFLDEKNQKTAIRNLLDKSKVDFLICIGGNGTMKGALALAEKGVNVLGIPATIDGDFLGYTLGLDSAASYNADLINEKFKPDSASMIDYIYCVKVMGRTAGHLPLLTAMQTGAEGCFLYEIGSEEEDIERTAKKIISNLEQGNSHVIICSEHETLADIPEKIERKIKEFIGRSVKIATEEVGRAQRSAPVIITDGLLAQKMGKIAVELILSAPGETRGKALVTLDKKHVYSEELPHAISNLNPLDVALYYEWLNDFGAFRQEDEKNLKKILRN